MWFRPTIVCFLLVFSYITADEKESLLVETKNGFVVGRKIDESIYGWNGIPYAKPPIGDLRFEPPQSADNWTGIWNATYDRNVCITISANFLLGFANPSGDEDCLYINVYTPHPPQKNGTLLPVMVWIYGGTFVAGNSTYALYGPDELVQKGTVVVTFNYRLGIFGFLSTNDSAAPGNAGLKDQILALRWVQCNIKAFGGDPSQVTVFGESAGAVSISYLVLSPLTKGLFRRAIMESGTALCLWSFSRKGREAAFAVGAQLGIRTSDSHLLINALKNVSAKSLERASYVAMGVILAGNPLNGLVFSPVIEPQNDSAVITRSPYEILSKGYFNQVPQLIGYNSAEAYLVKGLIRIFWLYIGTYDIIPARLVPASMNANSANLTTIGRKIKDFYVGRNGTFTLNERETLNYISDNEFVRPIQQSINLTSKYVTTYFYRFSYNRVSGALGASHADEIKYLFNSPYNSTDDRFVKRCITTLWTNFAKYGNPTPNNGSEVCGGVIWKPITPQNRNVFYYTDIDRKVTVGENPNAANMTFWRDLFDEYAIPPFKTLLKVFKNSQSSCLCYLGILALNSRRLVNGLKKVPTKMLRDVSFVVMGTILVQDLFNGFVFAPVIEPQSDTAVIIKSSYEKLQKGELHRMPHLIGYNSAEVYFFKSYLEPLRFYYITYDLKPHRLVPASMNSKLVDLPIIAEKIKIFYVGLLGSFAVNNPRMINVSATFSSQFVRPIQESVRLLPKYVTTYFYRFSYSNTPGALGAKHCDDLSYLFNSGYNSPSNRFIKKCMTTLWTNFAKYGNPTPKNGSKVCDGVVWKPITPQDRKALYYEDINTKVSSGKNPDKSNMTFWQDLFSQYANPPFYMC